MPERWIKVDGTQVWVAPHMANLSAEAIIEFVRKANAESAARKATETRAAAIARRKGKYRPPYREA